MRTTLRIIAYCAGLCCTAVSAHAADRILFASEATRMPLGCRAMAMGDAGVALPLDAIGAYWNPAIASFRPRYEAWAEGGRMFGGLSHQGVLALGIPIQDGLNTAVLYSAFFPGPIDAFDSLPGTYVERQADYRQWEPTGYFKDNHNLVVASVAKSYSIPIPRPAGLSYPLPVDIGVGVNVKCYWQSMTPANKVRMGVNVNLDAGLMLTIGVDYDVITRAPSRRVCIGAALRNVVPTDVVWLHSPEGYREPVDNSQYYGISYLDDVGLGWLTWKAAIALHRTPGGAETGDVEGKDQTKRAFHNASHIGIELGFFKLADFRAGLSDRMPTLGAGVHYKRISLDYTFRFDTIDYSVLRLALGVTY